MPFKLLCNPKQAAQFHSQGGFCPSLCSSPSGTPWNTPCTHILWSPWRCTTRVPFKKHLLPGWGKCGHQQPLCARIFTVCLSHFTPGYALQGQLTNQELSQVGSLRCSHFRVTPDSWEGQYVLQSSLLGGLRLCGSSWHLSLCNPTFFPFFSLVLIPNKELAPQIPAHHLLLNNSICNIGLHESDSVLQSLLKSFSSSKVQLKWYLQKTFFHPSNWE